MAVSTKDSFDIRQVIAVSNGSRYADPLALYRAQERFQKLWKIQRLFQGREILVPNDTHTLKLLYGGKGRGKLGALKDKVEASKERRAKSKPTSKKIKPERGLSQNKENTFINPTAPTMCYSDIKEQVKAAVRSKYVNYSNEAKNNKGEEEKLKAITLYDTINGVLSSILHKRLLQWYYKCTGEKGVYARTIKDGLDTLNEVLTKAILRKYFSVYLSLYK